MLRKKVNINVIYSLLTFLMNESLVSLFNLIILRRCFSNNVIQSVPGGMDKTSGECSLC